MEFFVRQVAIYSAAIKASVLAKVMAPNGPGMRELAREFNIPSSTIHTWKKQMLSKQDGKQVNAPQRPNDKSPEVKLQVVLDTMNMSEQELGAYCRAQGIYSQHLETWKKQMLEGLGATTSVKEHKAENLQMMNEVKKLKHDLHRKDKALAEVSALLILKKKANLLWGVDEDA
jgi:hypothetical protein